MLELLRKGNDDSFSNLPFGFWHWNSLPCFILPSGWTGNLIELRNGRTLKCHISAAFIDLYKVAIKKTVGNGKWIRPGLYRLSCSLYQFRFLQGFLNSKRFWIMLWAFMQKSHAFGMPLSITKLAFWQYCKNLRNFWVLTLILVCFINNELQFCKWRLCEELCMKHR